MLNELLDNTNNNNLHIFKQGVQYVIVIIACVGHVGFCFEVQYWFQNKPGKTKQTLPGVL